MRVFRIYPSRRVERHNAVFEMLVVVGEMRRGVLNRVGSVSGISWVSEDVAGQVGRIET